MLINEDFFDNLDVKDEDINDAIAADDALEDNIPDMSDPMALNEHFDLCYDNTLMIKFDYGYKSLNHMSMLWKHDIPYVLKMIQYLLQSYNINKYEYTFRDSSSHYSEYHELKPHRIENFTVFSSLSEEELSKPDQTRSIYLLIYMNIPKLTYKQSYYFIDRLQNAIWKKDTTYAIWFEISNEPISLMSLDSKSTTVFYLDKYNKDYLINDKTNPPFKYFFNNALKFFHNTKKHRQIIDRMRDDIYKGINPFTKES